VIMVFRRAMQKARCLSPLTTSANCSRSIFRQLVAPIACTDADRGAELSSASSPKKSPGSYPSYTGLPSRGRVCHSVLIFT
jgi:hypothetical protein